LAGGQHHLRILMDKYHPGYFGKVGMRHFHLKRNVYFCPTINVEGLWNLVSKEARAEFKKDKSKVPVLNVRHKGFFKVLGRGTLPKMPMIVKAKFFSKLAENKIKAAGGACVLTA